MESAILGLVGVVIDGLLTIAKDWWLQNRKSRKDAEYLSIQVSCELERYVAGCADVVGDDGLCEGRPDENGYSTPQVMRGGDAGSFCPFAPFPPQKLPNCAGT